MTDPKPEYVERPRTPAGQYASWAGAGLVLFGAGLCSASLWCLPIPIVGAIVAVVAYVWF